MSQTNLDSFGARQTLVVGDARYEYYALDALAQAGIGHVHRLPFSLKVLVENLLRHEDGVAVTAADVEAAAGWDPKAEPNFEIGFHPARVLLQDFTGVPVVVDLAAMRQAIQGMGGDAQRINPLAPVDLVIDHSVQVDHFGSKDALTLNMQLEYQRNRERYAFLRWGQAALSNFRAVPPGTGICHQVNLEYLARTVWTKQHGDVTQAFPDTVVGTDSHTTMVNGLAVLGWGVGGIEAEAAMLGQPMSMLIPQVVGFKLHGTLPDGATATDLVLTVTQMLRKHGVVNKFVEFYGPGLSALSLTDRATIANMAPEYGATCGFFPIDDETLAYLRFTNRPEATVALVEAYAKAQGLFRTDATPDPVFSSSIELDLATVESSLAGPKRPQDRVALPNVKANFLDALTKERHGDAAIEVKDGTSYELSNGAVVIAAITSCTNTSNPSVLIAAGLLARNAVRAGLARKPWVKTSLAPGSKVVTEYLEKSGLMRDLEALGFDLVGYGCTTCIGNSGPLPNAVSQAITDGNLVVAAVLSGNRNFEGRVHAQVRANYLASPPLVVAHALSGHLGVDLSRDPIGNGKDGQPVYLKDIWPSAAEIRDTVRAVIGREMYAEQYADVFAGDASWRALDVPTGQLFAWEADSTYVRHPPYFVGMKAKPDPLTDIVGARVLAKLGDSITTDHISPAGNISKNSPAAKYLVTHGVQPVDFNSYGARRGNHEVMIRGTFANIRLKNALVPGVEGGVTRHLPDGAQMSIFEAAEKYQAEGVPTVVLAGAEYGTGSSRDWAAKGTMLLGVKAVIAKSFERIHRSNLVGMGVLPLCFLDGQDADTLGLGGEEVFEIHGVAAGLTPKKTLKVTATAADGSVKAFDVVCRVDTPNEVEYVKHGGILQFVLRGMAQG
ncbi:MAG: aconitate hydratase AcnA [Deltaproteobacteria bacterium]|nr:aconitate hydratase AcnA [Deltaproteobacteria bacterium]MBK8713211.1 aconitate hydratase AcnA [Deltaproteobacteria bacterium]MBP7286789.1 aconitate hydratase AcnA [Nannocystaceae bacterium]